MKNFIISAILAIFLFLTHITTYAQDSCQVALMSATEAFEKGMYQKVVFLLVGRIDKCDYSKEARLQALKILSASFAALDEVELAEAATLKLLKQNPVYKLQSIDPLTFDDVFMKFDVKPRFAVGINLGIQMPLLLVKKKYNISNFPEYESNYSVSKTFTFNASAQWFFLPQFFAVAEFGFTRINFTKSISFGNLYRLNYNEEFRDIKLPLYFGYSVLKHKLLSANLLAGVYLTSVEIPTNTNTFTVGTSDPKSVDAVSVSGRNSRNIGFLGGMQLTYNAERFNFVLQSRYLYDINLYNKPEARYQNLNTNLNFWYVDDDIQFARTEILVGVYYTLFYKIKHKYRK